MSFKLVEHTLTADLVTGGTSTVSYPAGTKIGDFLGAIGHKISAPNGGDYSSPKDFTLTLGASNITLTWLHTTTLVSGSTIYIQIEEPGEDDGKVEDMRGHGKASYAPVVLLNLGSPATADDDALIDAATSTELPNGTTVLSKTYTFPADASPVDGARKDGVLDVPRNLICKQTLATTVAATVLIKGLDVAGNDMEELYTFAGGVSTSETKTGAKAFAKVLSALISSAVDMTSATLDIGFGDVLGLPVMLPSKANVLAEIEDNVLLARSPSPIRIPFLLDATKYNAGTSLFVVSPIAGNVTKLVVGVQVQTAGAGAVGIEIGGTAVDGLSCVVPDGSLVGAVVSDTPSSATHATTAITAGGAIEITSDGTPTAGELTGYIEVTPSNIYNGTIVVGSAITATNATGDVRGTYDPASACDGSKTFALLAALPDPTSQGIAQYTS